MYMQFRKRKHSSYLPRDSVMLSVSVGILLPVAELVCTGSGLLIEILVEVLEVQSSESVSS